MLLLLLNLLLGCGNGSDATDAKATKSFRGTLSLFSASNALQMLPDLMAKEEDGSHEDRRGHDVEGCKHELSIHKHAEPSDGSNDAEGEGWVDEVHDREEAANERSN